MSALCKPAMAVSKLVSKLKPQHATGNSSRCFKQAAFSLTPSFQPQHYILSILSIFTLGPSSLTANNGHLNY